MSEPMSERAQPFHCPYCGDENLFPREGAGCLGVPLVPAQLHREDDRHDPRTPAGPRATEAHA